VRTSIRSGLVLAVVLVAGGIVAPSSASAATWQAVDTIAGTGLASTLETFGAVPVDYNGDGREDVLFGHHDQGARLFRNEGNGTYTRVAAAAWPKLDPVSGLNPDRHECAWADVDGDGRPDAYCGAGRTGNNVVKTGMDNELWLQRNPGVFTDVGTQWGLGDVCGRTWAVTFINANGDRWPDLYVGNIRPRAVPNDPCANPANGFPDRFAKLYLNTGGTGFRYVPNAGLAQYGGQAGAEVTDFNHDGWQDLLTCGGDGMHLYRNDAGRGFTDVSAANGFGTTGVSGAKIGDLNGDGWADLVTSSNKQFGYRLNNNGRFGPLVQIAATTGGRAVALGDADGNGTLDVYALNANIAQVKNPQDFIYRNVGLHFTAVPVPNTSGTGDAVTALDGNNDHRAEFLVLNAYETTAPAQRIQLVLR